MTADLCGFSLSGWDQDAIDIRHCGPHTSQLLRTLHVFEANKELPK